jgi:hypothetical protein
VSCLAGHTQGFSGTLTSHKDVGHCQKWSVFVHDGYPRSDALDPVIGAAVKNSRPTSHEPRSNDGFDSRTWIRCQARHWLNVDPVEGGAASLRLFFYGFASRFPKDVSVSF